MTERLKGVLAPVVTPFTQDLAPDAKRFVRHCKWLLGHGCSGLAVFGTNSEANSLSAEERMMLLEELVQAGVPAEKLMPGTGCCALTDSVRLTAHAVKLGCAGVLMLPPFYYKGVPDEGLFRNFAEVIERVADERLQLYLYHIPPVAQVPITLGLIERLLARYPRIVAGIKDSSGDWNNTQAVLDAFVGKSGGKQGFDVFAGSEVFLLRNMRAGGVGCITAGANVNPHGIDRAYRGWETPEAEKLQASIDAVRKVLQSQVSMIPALKATIAHYAGDAGWSAVRPPLVELTADQQSAMVKALQALGFEMPGIR
ncbi:MAG: dihydrodipicolinate synthase family protein [Burkholderiales bacterium]|nr:dihydrodipicolinate synthase family protein [Burkholderiales bacterium]